MQMLVNSFQTMEGVRESLFKIYLASSVFRCLSIEVNALSKSSGLGTDPPLKGILQKCKCYSHYLLYLIAN